jgi:hypothetical protein
VAARGGLLVVEQTAARHDARSEIGAGDARTLLRGLHRLTRDAELAAVADGRTQAIGQLLGERRRLGRIHDARDGADVEADSEVEGRYRDSLLFLGNIENPLCLGQGDLGTQDLLALDDAAASQLLGHSQIVLAATDGFAGNAAQRSAT